MTAGMVIHLQGEYVSNKQPTSLVKFADADSAIKILSDSKLRWSAPSLFKDPFELSHRSSLNFDSKGLLVACVKNTLGLIFSRDDPSGNSPLIKAIKRWRAEERFDSEDEATEVLSELLLSMVNHREPEMLQIVRDWKNYSQSLRILCLSETHESAALWEQHAQQHSGIAIRIACGDEYSLEQPQPVTYSENKPELSTLNEQMDILMNQSEISVQDSFSEKFLCKSKAKNTEKEWRLLKSVDETYKEDDESRWYEDLDFSQQEVRAVYLGADMEPSKKQKVNSILLRNYPKAKVFQAITCVNRFELDFERCNLS